MFSKCLGHLSRYSVQVVRTFQEDKNINTKRDLVEYIGKTTLLSSINNTVIKGGANWFLPDNNELMIYLTLPVIFQLIPNAYRALDIDWQPISMEDCKNFMRGIPINIINSLIIAGLIYANGELNTQFQNPKNTDIAVKIIDLAVGVGLGLVGIPLMDLAAAAIKAINSTNSTDTNSLAYQKLPRNSINSDDSAASTIKDLDLENEDNDEIQIDINYR